MFRTEPEKTYASSAEIAKALELDQQQTALLGQLVSVGNFGGGSNPQEKTWTTSAMPEAKRFPDGDLSDEVDQWVCRFYQPGGVVLQEQFLQQYSSHPSSAMLAGNTPQPVPSELVFPLDRLREKYPDQKKLGFLIMRFTAAKPYQRIVDVIKHTAQGHGLVVIRADENEFHADLWGNVRTLLHGCGFGITVYERIDTNEPNANVGLEVGYLMAMHKPVLLLKDKTVPALQSDLAGKLYKPFDPHDPKGTLPDQLSNWFEDNGIIVPKRT